MSFNFHTHSAFSDGKNTPEEIVLSAIEKGFISLGFSDHGHTAYDVRYCMTDEQGYVAEIRRLKEKYKGKLQIYLGIEEDSRALIDRTKYDYIVGSCHYACMKGKCVPFDSKYEMFTSALELFDDELEFAKEYYWHFTEYIRTRKPDIIGHFDLVTKFDEKEQDRYLSNPRYWEIAEAYTLEALKADCIFEVNTGLISRGYRTTPCPNERLLRFICKHDGKVTVSTDSHAVETLNFHFEETKKLLKDVGFSCVYALLDGEWKKVSI